MVGNLATQAPIYNGNYTTVGATTMGYNTGQLYPVDTLVVSTASAATFTLPKIAITSTALGFGDNQQLRIFNAAAIAVSAVAASGDTIVGSATTIAQNVGAVYLSDAKNNRWIRLQG